MRTAPGQHGAEQQDAQRGKGQAGDRHQPDRSDPEQVADDHHPAAREEVRQAGQQRAARDRRQVGERVGQRGEERRMGSAVDQDGDGHLSELVTGEGEYLGAPQRTELADGEDLAVGRPRLGCPPVAARVDGLGFVPGLRPGPRPRRARPGAQTSRSGSRSGVGQGGMRRMAGFAVKHAKPPGRPSDTRRDRRRMSALSNSHIAYRV
jgi:hypothetical protein